MATRRNSERLSQLWQFPLLLLSVGLFAVAAYLFISPHWVTLDEKIAVARDYLKNDRPTAALEQLNKILQTSTLTPQEQAPIHLLLAQSLAAAQIQLKLDIPENHRRIIEQMQMALDGGAQADASAHRILGESYAALNDTASAVEHYQQAIALDGDHAVNLRRKVIDLLLVDEQTLPAEQAIDEYLKQPGLAAAERSWALSQKAGLLIDRQEFAQARKILAAALKLTTDTVEQGELSYRLGYCAWKEGDAAQAERYLRVARDQMKESHPLDGDAAYVLGRIYQDKNDPQTANSFYEVTLVSHPESTVAGLALLGRGTCRLMLDQTDAGLTDLHDLTAEVARRQTRPGRMAEVVGGLRRASRLLIDKENYQGALEVMAYEQQLDPDPSAGFYARLGEVYERRADQLEQSSGGSEADQIRRAQEVRDQRAKAGDAYVADSRALTMTDDKGYGDALWHGIDLYDASGDMQRVISALELFVAERPQDKLAPDALLRLGRAYQAVGLFDKAIAAFQRNQFRYPKSLAASKSAVPLAEAYMARGPDNYGKAEKVLLSVVEDNDLVDPGAEEFHQALMELAQLYYRTQRYEDAIARLEEIVQRYPTDQQLPQITFLMADSYRKSASLLDNRLASAGTGADEAGAAIAAQRQRWSQARELFDKVLALYSASPPTGEVDKLYEKLSTFYRADCMYDLGEYQEAIKLYDEAAFKYQDDPAALAAYVQIVNSYCALGKFDDARTANERAKWILRRMPDEAFKDDSFSMPKKYWDDWLKWTNESGVF
jgi:tetratricopeptide (TPR) repeat protein